jgi:3-dehydroquinate synthase class II
MCTTRLTIAVPGSHKIGILSLPALSMPDILIVVPRYGEDTIITVPADVAGADYSMLRRVWMLQWADDTDYSGINQSSSEEGTQVAGKYSLASKTVLVSLQDLGGAPRKRVEIVWYRNS